jgi:hypothetical protein
MSEKIPQSNHEKQPTTFLVMRSNGEIQSGTLTNRIQIKHVLQRDGTYLDMTLREVAFPKTIGPDGDEVIPTKYVPEFALSDEYQENLVRQLESSVEASQSESVPAGESNIYDNLLSAHYDENNHSVEGAANREIDTALRQQEMLEYADVALSAAMRNDTDLQQVIEAAFTQAGLQLPNDKSDLITTMRTDARVRASVQHYLREKAEYYRSILPRRVRENHSKRPSFPGGVPEPSLDVATNYAVSMITGEWDQSREDGKVERDSGGNAILGQHRDAARIILTSPRMKGNE